MYYDAQKSSTPKASLFEKSSSTAAFPPAFSDFILRLRVTATPRGELIALFKTLINARAFSAFTCWAELYRFVVARGSSGSTIADARRLWNEYRKSQPAASPGHTPARKNYG
jgi:hypothetical protein